MRSRTTIAATVVVLGIGWPGLAGAQNRTDLQMLADMRMLHEELQQTRLLINTLAEQIKATNTRLDGLERSVVKSFADQKLDIDEMTTAAARLTDKVSDNSVRVGQFASELTSIREGIGLSNTMLDQVLKLIQPPPMPVIDPVLGEPVPPTGPPALPPLTRPTQADPSRMPQSALAAYTQANGLYMGTQYALAAERFRLFVDDFPADPNAPNALFHLGMSHYYLKDFKAAITAFAEVGAKYPSSERVPEALYYQGLCHEQLKQMTEAKKLYNQVIQSYPDSSARLQAQQRLQRIGGFD